MKPMQVLSVDASSVSLLRQILNRPSSIYRIGVEGVAYEVVINDGDTNANRVIFDQTLQPGEAASFDANPLRVTDYAQIAQSIPTGVTVKIYYSVD